VPPGPAGMPPARAHVAIASAAAAAVGLPRECAQGLLRGVVEPDEVEDREVVVVTRRGGPYARERRVRHHQTLPRDLIEYYYNLACYYRAVGDLYNAGRALGRAVHYLQDWSLDARNPRVHDRAEREMSRLASELPELCSRVRPRRSTDPAEALCAGFRETARLLMRFLSEPPADPREALREYRRAKAAKWGLGASLAGALALALYMQWAAPAALILVALALLASWTPRGYIRAMRAGLVVVRPRRYRTAM